MRSRLVCVFSKNLEADSAEFTNYNRPKNVGKTLRSRYVLKNPTTHSFTGSITIKKTCHFKKNQIESKIIATAHSNTKTSMLTLPLVLK